MKLNSVVKEALVLIVLLLAPVMGIVFCSIEIAHRRSFERIEREFYRTDQLYELQLRVILTNYEGQTSEQVERLHANYLHDGTFALLDALDAAQAERIAQMTRLCPLACIGRLADCIRCYERRSRAADLAEIPSPLRGIPHGLADYLLLPDPE